MATKSRKTRGLGRGLDALFADQASIIPKEEGSRSEKEGSIIYVNINDIKPNENQPRKVFDEEKIEELGASIKAHGIIQPLVVRKRKDIYEIVAGERRWRAARKAGLKEVPCIIRSFTDEENMLIAIIENMQRENLNPIEEAVGLNEMIKTYGLTQEEVSKSISKSRPYISNSLRLLKLPDEIQKYVANGKISGGHARALININNKKKQTEICDRIIKEGLSVRETEALASGKTKKRAKALTKVKNHDTKLVENQLKELYGTKVLIDYRGNKGSINLEFYSKEELNRLIDLLKTVKEK